MSRIRTIKPSFFKNELLADLAPQVRLLFIGLWTLADKEGKLEDRPKRVKAELFPYDNYDIDDLLKRLQSSGFIQRYAVADLKVIKVLNFHKHQRITGSEADSESELPEPPEGSILETFGNTEETPRTTGREGKGKEKEGKGKEDAPILTSLKNEKIKNEAFKDHLFSESEFFDFKKFEGAFAGTDYERCDLTFYYENVKNWSRGKGAKRKDWIATARNFMLSDSRDNKLKLKPQFKTIDNGFSKERSSYIDQKITERNRIA